jgi:hypothetical protein
MYFPTIDTILNLLTTGLFIFYMKKKLDENEHLKRAFFLNFDFFTSTLDIYLQENLHFYTDDDKKQFMENTTKMNDCIIKTGQLLLNEIQEKIQIVKQIVGGFQFQTDTKEETNDIVETKEEPKPIIFEEKYKEEYKKAEEFELSKERVEQLKNSILIEVTPLGNVVMYYDSSRETFTYYSDSTMPYRYLEVVARKYVVTNRCKKLYIDMEKELKEAQEKLEKKQKEEEDLKQQMEEKKETTAAPPKKNVFAKLKNYNKDNSLKMAGIPSDNKSVSKKIVSQPDKNEQLLLKENANRYSYEGKLVNFSFLKKVERKVVDKTYAMNFADFKKMMFDKKNKT